MAIIRPSRPGGGGNAGDVVPIGAGGVVGEPIPPPPPPLKSSPDDGSPPPPKNKGDKDLEIPDFDTPDPSQTRQALPSFPTQPAVRSPSNYIDQLPAQGPSSIRRPLNVKSNDDCKVDDRELRSLASTEIEGTSSTLEGISWIEGFWSYSGASSAVILQSFYLDTPQNVSISKAVGGGCALFFTESTSNVAFVGSEVKGKHGTCDWAMNEKCVDTMLTRAGKLSVQGSETEVCEGLKKEFENNLDKGCEQFAGSDWTGLVVKPLSQLKPYDETKKKASSCWPTRDEDNNLALVSTIKQEVANTKASKSASANLRNRMLASYSTTPILTLFFPGNGSLISETEAQMTCIKPMSVKSQSGDDGSDHTTSSSQPQSNPANSAAKSVALGGDLVGLVLCLWLFVMTGLMGDGRRRR